jgi:glycosyltransferase involved in cell wall biosynthesis
LISLSVITPVLNGANFITACLENVIAQNCHECEHLVVDGCSTDGTLDVLRDYERRFPHIRWISQVDGGQSDAMNRGVAAARGSVLGFLNVDDTYEPGVLNQIVHRFKLLTSPSLLVGNCNIWDADARLRLVNRPRRLEYFDLLLGPAVNPYPYNPSAYFYHAQLHKVVGLFDSNDHYSMDLDFILRTTRAAWRGIASVIYMDETWGNFHLHAKAKTYQDMLAGRTSERQREILRRFRQSLPPGIRHWHTLRYWILAELMISVRYFAMHPHELPARLARRLGSFFQSNHGAK